MTNPFDEESEQSEGEQTPNWLREARDALPPAPAQASQSQQPHSTNNPFADAISDPFAKIAIADPAAALPPLPSQGSGEWQAASSAADTPELFVPPPDSVPPPESASDAEPPPPTPPPPAAPIEVEPATFAADMAHGCASLLASGRHADVSFELPARTLKAHRAILEARCGAQLVEALESGAIGEAPSESFRGDGEVDGVIKIRMTTQAVGDPSGASLAALLRYLYTERFDPEALSGRGGALALLRLVTIFEAAGSSAALERLRQLCEKELAEAVVPETVVATAHEASELGASQLLRFCLQEMNRGFEELHVSGELAELQTNLCAELFKLRSEAALQDALSHGRADVAEHLLTLAATTAATPGGIDAEAAAGSVRALLSVLDAKGRTALEVALQHDELAAATKLLAQGAPVDAMASGTDEPLMHTVCCSPPPPAGGGGGGGGTGGGAASTAASDTRGRKLQLLLEHGAAVDAMNGRGESALDVAFFNGGPSIVALLLKHSAKSTMTTEDGGCLLHAAALARRSDVLSAALESLASISVDLNQQDRFGRTPLHVGVASGIAELVQPLLRRRAGLEVQADDGATPLRLAVSQGDLTLTKLLLDVGAERNSLGADAVPLIVLATETSVHVALALVQAGADLNQPDAAGRTALEVAVAKGEYELCELLLTKGARPTNRKDPSGNTSLHVAVFNHAENLVRLLVRHKAELSDQNRRGQTPLILGAETGQAAVVELLLHSGAALHLCDASNRSALELALQNGHLEVLKILLQQSMVDVNGMSKRGSSLLHLAAEIGDESRVAFLLEMQASVDVLNANGETPLHWACSLGHLAVVRSLVHYGANAMIHERVQGLTPLHAACGSRGQSAVLALLIQRCEAMAWNSNPQKCNLLDGNRNTPLHTATKLAPQASKYLPILLEHGANPNLQNAQGQNALHLLAERAVREQQEREQHERRQHEEQTQGAGGGGGGGANGNGNGAQQLAPEFPALRLLELLAGTEHVLQLDTQELESGNTALHHAAFGGCIDLAVKLVGLGAAVGLPNRDGFTPLDSSYRSTADPSRSLQSLLLSHIKKPMSWTPDRTVSACQSCKLPFNKADPKMARKHHCRHCGRCICSPCSPHRIAIPKFASEQQERVCLLCERVLTEGS